MLPSCVVSLLARLRRTCPRVMTWPDPLFAGLGTVVARAIIRSDYGRSPRPPPSGEAEPDTERHRLPTAVTALLVEIPRDRPAVLVLEDGHWADVPTLLLLRHLTRAAGNARVLLLTTFRDTEADVSEALSET